MNLRKIFLAPVTAAAVFAAPAAFAAEHAGHDHAGHTAAEGGAAKAKDVKGAQVIEVTVTKDGFVPSTVTVKQGKPVKLVVTRKVERTCATEIVSKALGVNQPLPLEKAVTVNLKPQKQGEYRFACAMDMIAGTLKVE